MTFERLLGRDRRRRRHGRGGGRLAGGVAGVAAGMGLMYFLDPRRGPARRSEVTQRAGRVLRDVETTVEAGARDLRHRARGVAHEARARIEHDEASDVVIAERVRAKLGRLCSHPGAIEVAVRDRRVELSGPIFRAEHAQVIRGIRLVRGVRGVEDRLRPHETAEGVPALQGAGPRPGPRPEPLQRNWSPGTKLLAGAAGAFLAGRALFGSGFARIPAGVAGAALLGKVMGESGPAAREGRRLAHAAGELVARARDERGGRAGQRGPGRREPEIREVKSPAELEPGIASASPEPTFSNRADRGARGARSRRGRGGSRAQRGWGASAAAPEAAREEAGEEVTPHADYVAPPEGAGVREPDLGSVGPRGAGGGEEEGAIRGGAEGEGESRRPLGEPPNVE